MIDRNSVLNLAGKSTDINEYLMSIYNIPVQINAQTVVELGCGNSTVALLAAVNKTQGQLYCFDVGADSFTRSGLEDEIRKEPRFHFTQGFVLESVKQWNKPIDFLLHDLSHLYDSTKDEIAAWFPFVRSGGIIFAHDTNHEAGDGMGCRQAYNEFMDSEEGKKYRIIHLLDTKILGGSVLIKL